MEKLILSSFKEQDLADIIKNKENAFDICVDVNKPIFVRCDGRSFKNFTKGFEKPFDKVFRTVMERTMLDILNEVQCASLGYTQSDEITIMFEKTSDETEIIFSGRVQKIVTVCASVASVSFNKYFIEETEAKYREDLKRLNENLASEEEFERLELNVAKMRAKYFKAHFDGRIFNIEKDIKYLPFFWRYLDCHKNATQMVARSLFSTKELCHKHTNEMIDMIKSKNIDFYSYPGRYIDGVCAIKKETVLYEGTERECIRNKWTIIDSKSYFEDILEKERDNYISYSRKYFEKK